MSFDQYGALKFTFSQGSLNIHSIDNDPQHPIPSPFTALFRFQSHVNMPRPLFDLQHLVEIRTTIHLINDSDDFFDDLDDMFYMWDHDELICLNNLEALQIGIHFNGNNPLGKPLAQLQLEDYLIELRMGWDPDLVFQILNRVGRRLKPLRECARRYELEITFDNFLFDDVLRGWEEKMAAEERGRRHGRRSRHSTIGSHED